MDGDGWAYIGASLVIAAAMLPPGLALAILIGAWRGAWFSAGPHVHVIERKDDDAHDDSDERPGQG